MIIGLPVTMTSMALTSRWDGLARMGACRKRKGGGSVQLSAINRVAGGGRLARRSGRRARRLSSAQLCAHPSVWPTTKEGMWPDQPSASGGSLMFGGCAVPFDSAHGRPHGEPFDSAHGEPFDSAHGKLIQPTPSGLRQPPLGGVSRGGAIFTISASLGRIASPGEGEFPCASARRGKSARPIMSRIARLGYLSAEARS